MTQIQRFMKIITCLQITVIIGFEIVRPTLELTDGRTRISLGDQHNRLRADHVPIVNRKEDRNSALKDIVFSQRKNAANSVIQRVLSRAINDETFRQRHHGDVHAVNNTRSDETLTEKSVLPHSNSALKDLLFVNNIHNTNTTLVDVHHDKNYRTTLKLKEAMDISWIQRQKRDVNTNSDGTTETINHHDQANVTESAVPVCKCNLTQVAIKPREPRKEDAIWSMVCISLLLFLLISAVWFSGMCHKRDTTEAIVGYVDGQQKMNVLDVLKNKARFLPMFRKKKKDLEIERESLLKEVETDQEDDIYNASWQRIT